MNPDSYCGIYCGACSVAVQGETGRADGFAACLGSVPKEEIACGGCKSQRLYAGCGLCGFRDCAVAKGIEHCIECADYPCRMFAKWRSAARFLPHVGEAASSLEAIKRVGGDVWLKEQKKRWSCPGCGAPFSWYASFCHACGRRFNSEAYRLTGWRKLLGRILLPMVYRKARSKLMGKQSLKKGQ